MVQELVAFVMVTSTSSRWLETGGSHQTPEISLNDYFRNAVMWDLLLSGAEFPNFAVKLLKVLSIIISHIKQNSVFSDSMP